MLRNIIRLISGYYIGRTLQTVFSRVLSNTTDTKTGLTVVISCLLEIDNLGHIQLLASLRLRSHNASSGRWYWWLGR